MAEEPTRLERLSDLVGALPGVQSVSIRLGELVALSAQETAAGLVVGRNIDIEVVIFDREQNLVGRAPFKN